MDIKVIVATHKQYRMPSDNCYMPLHVGKQGKVDLGYLGDDSGDSISEKNGHYCELTGLYWAWKNLKSDYIGLVHYRRYLANRWRKLMFWKRDPFYSVLTKKEIEQLLKKTGNDNRLMQDLCFSHSNGFAFIPGGLDIEIAVPDVGIGIRLFSQQKDIILLRVCILIIHIRIMKNI